MLADEGSTPVIKMLMTGLGMCMPARILDKKAYGEQPIMNDLTILYPFDSVYLLLFARMNKSKVTRVLLEVYDCSSCDFQQTIRISNYRAPADVTQPKLRPFGR